MVGDAKGWLALKFDEFVYAPPVVGDGVGVVFIGRSLFNECCRPGVIPLMEVPDPIDGLFIPNMASGLLNK